MKNKKATNKNIQKKAMRGEKKKAPPPPRRKKSRVSIRKNVELSRYGPTAGCQGCIHSLAGLPARQHNEECRAMIEREMRQDPELCVKVEE